MADANLVVRCACGWTTTGAEDDVVAATVEHGRQLHNMEATREQVLALAVREPGGERAAAGAPEVEAPG